jgi:hypothetical protein
MQNVLVENLLIILNILIILVELNMLGLVAEKPVVGGFVRGSTASRTLFALSSIMVVRSTTPSAVANTSRRLSALVKGSF